MKIPRRTFEASINGDSKSLKESIFSLSGEIASKILWIRFPNQRPGWSIVFRSTHRQDLTFRHLLLKFLFQSLNQNEKVVFQQLAVGLPEQDWRKIRILISQNSKIKPNLQRILQLFVEYEFLGLKDPWREFLSFEPKLFIEKVWTREIRVPPKQVIGVGYKDKGTLSSALSWKDQISFDGEESTKDLLEVLLWKILEDPSSRSEPYQLFLRLTSSKRAK